MGLREVPDQSGKRTKRRTRAENEGLEDRETVEGEGEMKI